MAEFKREALLGTLDKLRPALATGGMVPEFSHLWFDDKNVCAYNNEGLGIRCKLVSDINCGLPGRPLLELIKTSALEQVAIVSSKKNGLVLKMGRSRVDLAYLEPDRKPWPDGWKALPKTEGLRLGEKFFEALDALSFVRVSEKQASTGVHKGITVLVEHSQIGLYVTDSRSAACMLVKANSVSMPKFIINWPLVSAIKALLSKAKNPQLWLLPDSIVAGVPGTMVAGNLIDFGGSPDHVGLLKKKVDQGTHPLPKGFKRFLERVMILAGRDRPTINVEVSKGTLRVGGRYSMGSVEEEFPTKMKARVEARFDADLIVRALPRATRMSVAADSMLLAGEEGFRYIVAVKEDGSANKARSSRSGGEG